VRVRSSSSGEKVLKGAALGMNLHMRTRLAVCIASILQPYERFAINRGRQLKLRSVDGHFRGPAGTLVERRDNPNRTRRRLIRPPHKYGPCIGKRRLEQVVHFIRELPGLLVQNGTDDVLNLDAVIVRLSFGPAGMQAEQAFDVEKGYEGLSGSLPPGGTGTARYAFAGVADPSMMTVEVVPGWNHDPAFW
jgi:hypothetical protein